MAKDRHRVAAVIESVQGPHDNEHGGLSTWVHLELDSWHQGFGGLMLDARLADDYVRELCVTFGVRGMDELVGKKCFALYSFGKHNESIEGLESCDTGKRFLHNKWRKKHFPDTQDTLSQERERIQSTITWAKRRLADAKADLVNVEDEYVDWENK